MNINEILRQSELKEELMKAQSHKYYKREGARGNYKYYYTKAEYDKAKSEKGADEKKDEISPTYIKNLKGISYQKEIKIGGSKYRIGIFGESKVGFGRKKISAGNIEPSIVKVSRGDEEDWTTLMKPSEGFGLSFEAASKLIKEKISSKSELTGEEKESSKGPISENRKLSYKEHDKQAEGRKKPKELKPAERVKAAKQILKNKINVPAVKKKMAEIKQYLMDRRGYTAVEANEDKWEVFYEENETNPKLHYTPHMAAYEKDKSNPEIDVDSWDEAFYKLIKGV